MKKPNFRIAPLLFAANFLIGLLAIPLSGCVENMQYHIVLIEKYQGGIRTADKWVCTADQAKEYIRSYKVEEELVNVTITQGWAPDREITCAR